MSSKECVACLVILTAVSVAALGLADPAAAQTWTPTGSMNFTRSAHQATLLLDGRVLVSGGGDASNFAIPQAETFDPIAGTWSVTGSNIGARFDHAAVLLQDGRALVVGGVLASFFCSFNNTGEIYDPALGTWSSTPNLPTAVGTGASAVRLLDGRVLVAGGGNRCGGVFAAAALFDPVMGTWASTGSMTTGREFHSAALLSDGRVLVAGGVAPGGIFDSVATAEIYDPAMGMWTAVGSMATARSTSCNGYMQSYLARLANGDVLAAAADRTVPPFGCIFIQSRLLTGAAEVFNPGSLSWTSTGAMSVARASTTLTPLNDGRVLVAGGSDLATTVFASAELFDPATGTWFTTAALNAPRSTHTATRLADGRVLVAGGGVGSPATLTATAEIYDPVIEVGIDIKPGSFPNSINPRSRGVIPVAILTTGAFDATTVDPSSVKFGPNLATPVRAALQDVDGDGDADMILHFRTQDTGIMCGDTAASLTGETAGGQTIAGADSVRTAGCP